MAKVLETLKRRAKRWAMFEEGWFRDWRAIRSMLFKSEVDRMKSETPALNPIRILARAEGITERMVYRVLAGKG